MSRAVSSPEAEECEIAGLMDRIGRCQGKKVILKREKFQGKVAGCKNMQDQKRERAGSRANRNRRCPTIPAKIPAREMPPKNRRGHARL